MVKVFNFTQKAQKTLKSFSTTDNTDLHGCFVCCDFEENMLCRAYGSFM